MKRALLLGAFCMILSASATPSDVDASLTGESLTKQLASQVRAAETAFAQSMADRDFEAFASHIAEEAVFFGESAMRGRDAVLAGWKPLFAGPNAPFSWEPAQVEVLDSGTLAISSGPVRAPDGKQVGVFNSIWRREPDGSWKVIFDKGCPPCNCAGAGG